MVPKVNEIDGATEVNEDKHLVHGNRFKTSKKDALKTTRKCKQVKDSQGRGKLAEWLRYHSAKSGDELTSLRDYITGESKKAVESSQFLEELKKKGYGFLFMVDTIDEYAMGQLKEFEGKKLVPATNEGLKFDESQDGKKKQEALKEKFECLRKAINDVLDARLRKFQFLTMQWIPHVAQSQESKVGLQTCRGSWRPKHLETPAWLVTCPTPSPSNPNLIIAWNSRQSSVHLEQPHGHI